MVGFGVCPPLYPVFIACAILAGFAATVSGPATYLTVPPQWFDQMLGRSLALSQAGLSVGQIILPLLTALLIQNVGWRNAWIGMAAIVATVGIANCLLLIRDNESHRQARRSKQVSAILDGYDLRHAIRQSNFWLLVLAFPLSVAAIAGFALHVPSLLMDRGYSFSQAAIVPTVIGATSLVGRLVAGALLASRAGEFHPRALLEPYVNLSVHTAPDVRSLTRRKAQWAKRLGVARMTRANQSRAPFGRGRRRLYLLRAQRIRKASTRRSV
jgi:MFS family permease